MLLQLPFQLQHKFNPLRNSNVPQFDSLHLKHVSVRACGQGQVTYQPSLMQWDSHITVCVYTLSQTLIDGQQIKHVATSSLTRATILGEPITGQVITFKKRYIVRWKHAAWPLLTSDSKCCSDSAAAVISIENEISIKKLKVALENKQKFFIFSKTDYVLGVNTVSPGSEWLLTWFHHSGHLECFPWTLLMLVNSLGAHVLFKTTLQRHNEYVFDTFS